MENVTDGWQDVQFTDYSILDIEAQLPLYAFQSGQHTFCLLLIVIIMDDHFKSHSFYMSLASVDKDTSIFKNESIFPSQAVFLLFVFSFLVIRALL